MSKCCKSYRKRLEPHVLESLDLYIWQDNNSEIYDKLRSSNKLKEALEFLKTDLGSKLKFVKNFTLNCDIDCSFAEIFIELLPNIKTLSLSGAGVNICCLGEGLTAILKGMKRLEYVNFYQIDDAISRYTTDTKLFPKSIKSFKAWFRDSPAYSEDELGFYNTIDASYINLNSLTIISDIMLKNLTCGMPNLQKVEIDYIGDMDASNIVSFLKANSHIRKLTTIRFGDYNEEIFNAILSSKCLEYWCIDDTGFNEIEVYNLRSNYSIKYLEIDCSVPELLTLKIINACKNLKILDCMKYGTVKKLDLSKIELKINILKLSSFLLTIDDINGIDTSNKFNQIHIYLINPNEEFINEYNIGNPKNYKVIPYTPISCIRKLINKND
ncbi:hypothetical protein CONCODRAFT_10884 [Conidiobolus coronatus NRRL 28638]|uniref:RNI-like protein n=1 Tax=Conidiobolus coronatus (strain ATCC 28846 / CBS 209.66 / NRRL 28638) TaxID=796925 RepID=A0A137NWA6_CONC2|nr:hypothetical protein CONCODRAFT_10884 [Conidiobolus coronatus NRRL 28638]|eukprot:KXN67115.1 hypothetical protein CONCODRAFT_10884 [Conidiobolus coronatus NRRL 28638]